MSFNTISFMFVFFPISLILYYVLPRKIKPVVMILLSLVFYAWGDIKHIGVLIFSILFNYLSGLEIWERELRGEERGARFAMFVAVAADVLVLCVYKYVSKTLPLGISFYTFSVLSYIFDVYRGKADGEKNILHMALYVSFFPKIVSGPIVQYAGFREQIDTFAPSREGLIEGVELFLVGLFKKVLLADNLGRVFTAISGAVAMSVVTAWLGILSYCLQLYFDFSGYSDMAIGLGRMFGFRLDKNFDYPFTSKTLAEFYRRWHMTLGAWFRDYVYFPLGGSRCDTGKQIRNILVVWILTGLWHGSTLNFLAWGLFTGGIVLLEKYLVGDKLDGLPGGVRSFITNVLFLLSLSFFSAPSLGGGFHTLGQMLGFGHMGFWDRTATYYLMNNLLLLLAAMLFSTPIMRIIHENLIVKFPKGVVALSAVVYGVLLAFSIAGMVNATYSSFLYFQF